MSGYAAAHSGFDPRVRLYLLRSTSTPPSPWLQKVMGELRATEDAVCNHWDDLSDADKAFFRAVMRGDDPCPHSFRHTLGNVVWSVSTIWNITFHREEAVRYLNLAHEVFEAIHKRVSQEVWRETMDNGPFVEAASLGREEVRTGQTVTLKTTKA